MGFTAMLGWIEVMLPFGMPLATKGHAGTLLCVLFKQWLRNCSLLHCVNIQTVKTVFSSVAQCTMTWKQHEEANF